MAILTVQSLFVYPVKSLQGVKAAEADVARLGLVGDRRYMLVDPEGEFLTQRSIAPMATVGTRLEPDALWCARDGMPDLRVPFAACEETVRSKVWSFEGPAERVSDAADAWFSEALGLSARLVRKPDRTVRRINGVYGEGEIAYHDGMPILVASQSSLDLLNEKLDAPVPIDRFRANLVVNGGEPHVEDRWNRIVVNGVTLRRTKKCGRCLVVATDQKTGERGEEPLRTLATYRKQGNTVFFGSYYVPENEGRIRVGDSLEAVDDPG
jgi:uncharacterized protein